MFVGRTQIYTHTHTPIAHRHIKLYLWQANTPSYASCGRAARLILLDFKAVYSTNFGIALVQARCPYSPFSILSSPFSPPPFLRYALAEPTSRRFSPLHLLAKPLHVLRLLISVLFPFFCSFCCFRQHFGPN